jgi:hypothetical protein
MSSIQRAAAVTSATEEAIGKAEHALEAPRLINALGVYVDRWSVVTNLRTAKAGLDAAIAVAESCNWPTSADYLEV